MSRLNGLERNETGLVSRLLYFVTRLKLGRVPVPFKIAAHQTRLLGAVGMVELAHETMKSVPKPLKCLASIKVATLVGCPF